MFVSMMHFDLPIAILAQGGTRTREYPRMPVASTLIADATHLVATDGTSIVTLKSTVTKLQKRLSYLSFNGGHTEDMETINDLIVKIKHQMITRGQEANANVDSTLQHVAAMASGARSSNAVQGEVMSAGAAGAGVDVEKTCGVGGVCWRCKCCCGGGEGSRRRSFPGGSGSRR